MTDAYHRKIGDLLVILEKIDSLNQQLIRNKKFLQDMSLVQNYDCSVAEENRSIIKRIEEAKIRAISLKVYLDKARDTFRSTGKF